MTSWFGFAYATLNWWPFGRGSVSVFGVAGSISSGKDYGMHCKVEIAV